MIRHPDNINLTLFYEAMYKGFPVNVGNGPLITEYLERLLQTIEKALAQYSRVFVFRVDLRLPARIHFPEGEWLNGVISRFIDSFKKKIEHNRKLARAERKYAHNTCVRYVWARERGRHGRPHYHVAFLLNYDAFNVLGKFSSDGNNMAKRVRKAWASALALPVEMVRGLVEFVRGSAHAVYRGDWESAAKFFHRASYLCKAATKRFGDGSHGFGSSRI